MADAKEREFGNITSLTHCCRKIAQVFFKQILKSPTCFYSSVFEAALDLHVDDGYMTGPAERMMQVFAYLEGVIVLSLSPIIGVGDSFEHVGADALQRWMAILKF